MIQPSPGFLPLSKPRFSWTKPDPICVASGNFFSRFVHTVVISILMHFVVAETQQRDSYPQCFTTEIFGREKAKESRRDLGSCHRVISLLG